MKILIKDKIKEDIKQRDMKQRNIKQRTMKQKDVKTKNFKIIINKRLLSLIILMLLFAMNACEKSNINRPLVIGYNTFRGEFSPFFYETEEDAAVVRMTQASLLMLNREGEIVYESMNGKTIPYNGENHTYEGICDISVDYDKERDITNYTIKLRDDVLFSDGEQMTIDDVIFTYYVLADSSYDGKLTFQSLPIVGLDSYRKNPVYGEGAGDSKEEIPNIEGIKKVNDYEIVVQLSGFDETAIYKICGIYIAPLHYYGNKEMFDYQGNEFGFRKGDISSVKDKTSVPMGAGPYKFVKYDDKKVYLEANENYYMGKPKTTYVHLSEMKEEDKITEVVSGKIDLAELSANAEILEKLAEYNSNGEISGDVLTTYELGAHVYGYIGINAVNVSVGGNPSSEESKNLRKGFTTLFSAFREDMLREYYGDAAFVYPYDETSGGNKYESARETSLEHFIEAGYSYDERKKRLTDAPNGAKMEYEVVLPSDGNVNHPAYAIMTSVKDVLSEMGITLTIKDTDNNSLLDILNAQEQEMWVAEWNTADDSDLYQRYYSEYRVGLGNAELNYFGISEERLDQYIKDAHKSSDMVYRSSIHNVCNEIIRDWGVEVPLYERKSYVVINSKQLKMDSVSSDITPYWGWMDEIEKIEIKQRIK